MSKAVTPLSTLQGRKLIHRALLTDHKHTLICQRWSTVNKLTIWLNAKAPRRKMAEAFHLQLMVNSNKKIKRKLLEEMYSTMINRKIQMLKTSGHLCNRYLLNTGQTLITNIENEYVDACMMIIGGSYWKYYNFESYFWNYSNWFCPF